MARPRSRYFSGLLILAIALAAIAGWRFVYPLFREESIPKNIDSLLEHAAVWEVYRVSHIELNESVSVLGPFTIKVHDHVSVPSEKRRKILRAIRSGVDEANNVTPKWIAVEIPEFVLVAREGDNATFALFEFGVERVTFSDPLTPNKHTLNTTDRARSELLALFNPGS